jgi:hypothetical protein
MTRIILCAPGFSIHVLSVFLVQVQPSTAYHIQYKYTFKASISRLICSVVAALSSTQGNIRNESIETY